ncbi:hypothetical protein O1M54_00885 [Streptomyces diastatochromogenes]|nr:hypothetical protein [Streptomyces diastatochromogenes]MCZ0984593.1 hypothetical protein [Streptomyces diastatochromogenes]
MTPARARTWGRRGRTPVVRVRGRSRRRVSIAALTCYKAGARSRLIYRPRLDDGQGRSILLTTAIRATATGQQRLAVIDAATAAEIALATGLAARLSAQYPPHEAQARVEATRMLGPRLNLAERLGMTLPPRTRDDLLAPRNAVVHRGTPITDAAARAAVAVAQALVEDYEPLPAHCLEPDGWGDIEDGDE